MNLPDEDMVYHNTFKSGAELPPQLRDFIIISQASSKDNHFLGLDTKEGIKLYQKRFLEDPVLLTYYGDDLAGVISFGKNSKAKGKLAKLPYIRSVYVFENFRGEGIGNYMLLQLLNSEPTWWMLVNHDNENMLRMVCKFNFVRVMTDSKYYLMGSGEFENIEEATKC